jgi:hypothetical protein
VYFEKTFFERLYINEKEKEMKKILGITLVLFMLVSGLLFAASGVLIVNNSSRTLTLFVTIGSMTSSPFDLAPGEERFFSAREGQPVTIRHNYADSVGYTDKNGVWTFWDL